MRREPIYPFQIAILTLQKRYDEWREIWRGSNGDKDIKFEQYAQTEPESAERVLRQLALLSQTLFDVRTLEEQYGIRQSERAHRVS